MSRDSGSPQSSRSSEIEARPSTRGVARPDAAPLPPRPSGPRSEPPKSVRSPGSLPRLPGKSAGSSGQWRPLEQLVAPPPSSGPATMRPTALSVPPPPSSLAALADATGPHPSAVPSVGFRARASWGFAIVTLVVGLGLGAAMNHGERKGEALHAEAKTSAASAPLPAPISEPAPSVVPREEPPVEISLDEMAPAARAAKGISISIANSNPTPSPPPGSSVLPDDPYAPAVTAIAPAPAPQAARKSERELAKEARDLAAEQLNSLP